MPSLLLCKMGLLNMEIYLVLTDEDTEAQVTK